jgi:diacylglycerol kinase (ATP)
MAVIRCKASASDMHRLLRMRICVYWNPGAGDERPFDEINKAIAAAGHNVVRVLRQEDEVTAVLDMNVDAVVAAGGDGTVARVGRTLAGTELPVAILPLGTANNIATSLAISGDAAALAKSWTLDRRVHIDVGVVTDDRGEQLFLEGVGTGLVPRGITRGRDDTRKHDAEDAAAEVEWARQVFRDALADLQPTRSRLCIEGDVVEGDYLLVEVLNIASVGPRLRLSAETTPADGLLSVVIAGANDRDAIAAHLRTPWEDDDSHAWLKSWRAHTVEVAGWTEYHVDDQVRSSATGELAITIRPHFLAVLA